ncbi:MAG: nucleotide exchange factor GrpE, partial [Defluviitaleaceae bacterium]|nr:nucleotide exchange factor GrpE [Defluviitaleaceae bacterium]
YQREGHAYASINKAFFEAAARHRENLGRVVADIEPSEDFFDELGTVPAALDLPVLFEVFKAGFADNHAAFKAELDDAFNEMQSSFSSNIQSKKIYFCKKSIWQSGQMAEEFCAAFAHISKHFEKHSEELLTHEHGDIIKGVHETIGIKVETLRDAAQEFFTDADGKIESFGDEASGGADSQEFARVGTEFVLEWLFEIECLDSEFVKYIFDEFGKSDAFAGATAAITRAWDKREDIINKKIAAFMRDNLFFELTTFEEIMHYSVSRLRETEDAAVATFVEEIDKQHKHLDAILTKHDIEKITPAAHEPFNAKEHEVLMAELNPDFKKGEIIKTMNSGYKKGEQVIVRANVIAAR